MLEDHTQIEACIQAIRQRIQYRMNKQQIIINMCRFFPQETVFLCYYAAIYLENNFLNN